MCRVGFILWFNGGFLELAGSQWSVCFMFRGSHALNVWDGRSSKDPRTWKKINEDGIAIGRALLARSMSFHPFHLFGLDKGVYVERRVSWRSSTLERTADLQDEPEDFFYFQQRVREIPDDHCQKKKAQQQAVCYSLVCNCKLKSLGLCM